MNKMTRAILLSVCSFSIAAAQDPFASAARQPYSDSFMRECLLLQLEGQQVQPDEEAKRREAQLRERQFIEKVDRFVRLWALFAGDFNEKKVFNMKAAQQMSKAFRDLENSGGWAKPEEKRGPEEKPAR